MWGKDTLSFLNRGLTLYLIWPLTCKCGQVPLQIFWLSNHDDSNTFSWKMRNYWTPKCYHGVTDIFLRSCFKALFMPIVYTDQENNFGLYFWYGNKSRPQKRGALKKKKPHLQWQKRRPYLKSSGHFCFSLLLRNSMLPSFTKLWRVEYLGQKKTNSNLSFEV